MPPVQTLVSSTGSISRLDATSKTACPFLIDAICSTLFVKCDFIIQMYHPRSFHGFGHLALHILNLGLAYLFGRAVWKISNRFRWWRAVCRETNYQREALGESRRSEW
jgi:hypothetical protein